jgi:2-polyprenyl-3-methyl-5-hydroxy-6-metoxy-1,4-benzoquinol methylase
VGADLAPAWDLAAVLNDGERVTHLVADNVYHAHLSIYRFAAPCCLGRDVLDAGSGAGYGAAYLADAGARSVLGVDVSADAVGFSQGHFQRPNLRFEALDLAALDVGLGEQRFDLIFSSNVLEHLPDVAAFLRAAHGLLREGGAMIVAVPPITSPYLRAANLLNPYHLNLWSPRQWSHVLGQYFARVEHYLHCLGARGAILDFHQPLAETVTEDAWVFERVSLDELASIPTLSAVFVLREPRAAAELPLPGAPVAWVDGSFTRQAPEPLTQELAAELIRQGQQLEAQARQLQARDELIARKDAHIVYCEQLIGRLESGRAMRLLRRMERWRSGLRRRLRFGANS